MWADQEFGPLIGDTPPSRTVHPGPADSSIFDVISELVVANQSQTRPRIVIMADKDKVEMEDSCVEVE